MANTELTVEKLQALYFNADALRLPPVRLFRIDTDGFRVYYEVDAKQRIIFYPGITSMLQAVLPTPPQLIKWIADKGYDEAISYRDQRAEYGTTMHSIFAELLINRQVDFDKVTERVLGIIKECYLQGQADPVTWVSDMKKDILSFAKFLNDYKVRPLAIEIALRSEYFGFAAMLDLVCYMTIQQSGYWGESYKSGDQKGKPKETKKEVEILAIVDFKSGRKSYASDSVVLQLGAHRELLQENFPEFLGKEIHLYNWHPKDWRTEPSYGLNEHTSKSNIVSDLEHYTSLFFSHNDLYERVRVEYGKVLSLDKPLSDFFKVTPYTEIALHYQDLLTQEERGEPQGETFSLGSILNIINQDLLNIKATEHGKKRKNSKGGKRQSESAPPDNRENQGRGEERPGSTAEPRLL